MVVLRKRRDGRARSCPTAVCCSAGAEGDPLFCYFFPLQLSLSETIKE